MYGLIAGDICGHLWEGGTPAPDEYRAFDARARTSDDTVCAVAIMDSLMRGEPFADGLRRWVRAYPDQDYGGRFKRWALREGMEALPSTGNGGAMRVGPVGLWAARKNLDENQVFELSGLSCSVSHQTDGAIAGAQAVALSVWAFSRGWGAAATTDMVRRRTGIEPRQKVSDEHSFEALQTVPVSLWAANISSSTDDAIRRAVLQGGDTDTIGAMAGAIGEARWGVSADLIAHVESALADPMLEIVRAFYRAIAQ